MTCLSSASAKAELCEAFCRQVPLIIFSILQEKTGFVKRGVGGGCPYRGCGGSVWDRGALSSQLCFLQRPHPSVICFANATMVYGGFAWIASNSPPDCSTLGKGRQEVVRCSQRCTNLSAPLAKGGEVSGGHFGQIQCAIAHIDSSVSRRLTGGWRRRGQLYLNDSAACHAPRIRPFGAPMVYGGCAWIKSNSSPDRSPPGGKALYGVPPKGLFPKTCQEIFESCTFAYNFGPCSAKGKRRFFV